MSKSKKIINLIIVLILLISKAVYATEPETEEFDTSVRRHEVAPIEVPETDIRLKIPKAGRGCKVYLLLPIDLLRYNMERYISANTNNEFVTEAQKFNEINDLYRTNNYLGYIDYLNKFGFSAEKENQIEIRSYCFCIGKQHEIIGEYEYNSNKYIQILLHTTGEKEFELIMKDYLASYNSLNVKFMIDEYGTKTYINLENIGFRSEGAKRICDINYDYEPKEDYEEMEKAIKNTYLVIYIILIIVVLIILISIIRSIIKKKEEKEARKFWKKKLTKEEKKEQKAQLKELKKKNKENKKRKKR